jgi:RNase P protein component
MSTGWDVILIARSRIMHVKGPEVEQALATLLRESKLRADRFSDEE